MDMRTKVKQLGVSMWEQVTIILTPFLDFMDSFKHSQDHNMLALMLDLWFKDLNLIGDYVGHFLKQLRLLVHMITNFSSQPLIVYIINSMNGQMFLQVLCKKLCTTLILFLE